VAAAAAAAAGLALTAGVGPALASSKSSAPRASVRATMRPPFSVPITKLLAPQRSPAPTVKALGTGMSSSIGTPTLPQVVRRGATLRQVDPLRPGSFAGDAYRFAGVDAYELNSLWSVNVGCGPQLSDDQLDAVLSSVGGNGVVRAWFFQQFATNKYSGEIEWTALDRTVAAAAAHGVRLIATLGNQDGTCDDGTWKNPSWYTGGYGARATSPALSYIDWVQAATSRYAASPAILAWEPLNEPRPDTCTNTSNCWANRVCPDTLAARSALRKFYDALGTAIRSRDPNHLIADGGPPVQGCGTATFADLAYIESSPGIDLASYHKYDGAQAMAPSGAASWNALSAAVAKPFFAGENGNLNATPVALADRSCPLQSERAVAYDAEMTTDFGQLPGLAGWLFWNAMPTARSATPSCDYATYPGDPLLTVLRTEQARLNTRRP